jgi:hypothetical protein
MNTLPFNITRACIVTRRNSGDMISLVTDVPCPMSKDDKLSLNLVTPKDQGERWLNTNFPDLPYEVIDQAKGIVKEL